MSTTATDAQLRELLKSSAAAYEQRQNDLNTRELQVKKTLDMMIEIIDPIARYLTDLKVPAKAVRDAAGISLDVGKPPNVSGQLIIKVTPDFRLKITKRAIAPDGNIGTHEQIRDPSDFGVPHWRAELGSALTSMLGSYESGADEHDDEGND